MERLRSTERLYSNRNRLEDTDTKGFEKNLNATEENVEVEEIKDLDNLDDDNLNRSKW